MQGTKIIVPRMLLTESYFTGNFAKANSWACTTLYPLLCFESRRQIQVVFIDFEKMPGITALHERIVESQEENPKHNAADPAYSGSVGAHMISPQSVCWRGEAELGAKEAKGARGRLADIRENNKKAARDGLREFETDHGYLLAEEEPTQTWSVEPKSLKQSKAPFRWNSMQLDHIDGEVVASDQAYTDMILDQGASLPSGTTWSDFIRLDSLVDKSEVPLSPDIQYTNTHTLTYQGEVVWKLRTDHFCCYEGTWGQSSSCVLMKSKGLLRLKIIHKGRKNCGKGWNSMETREYRLEDFVKKSGEARSNDFFNQN